MSTIRQVAQLAGVSVATVSGVLNKTKKVTPEVQKRVEEALAALDYRPNALARGLFKGQTHTLAFLVPSISNPAFAENLLTIERHANERGYTVFVANTRGSKEMVNDYCNRLIEMHVDGVIMTMTWELAQDEVVQRLRQRGIQVVGCSGSRTLDTIDSFVVDEKKAGYDLGRYLLNLGHRSCVYVCPTDSTVASLRGDGLSEAFSYAEPPVAAPLATSFCSYDETSGEQAVLQLLAQGRRFSCIVAFNDLVATGILRALRQQGFTVPQQISVATFGDHYAKLTYPRLTTMAHSDSELGAMAIGRLIDTLQNPGDSTPVAQVIHKELIIRESTNAVLEFGKLRGSVE